MSRFGFVKPVITAAGILALSGVGFAQTASQSPRETSARAHEISSAPCPLPRVTKDKITEDQAQNLAQQYANKNLVGFTVVRPRGSWFDSRSYPESGPEYGGGYTTMCYQTAGSSSAPPQVIYSVEYSMDLKNPAGETRNLCVDQFGTVSEFCNSFGMAGATGPAGPIGPAGPTGAQGQVGPVGPQTAAGSENRMVSFGTGNNPAEFKDILFDTDKSDIRSNEMGKINDIAAHVKQNAPLDVSIGGYADPRGTDQHNQGLSERRVSAIRDALVKAGVAMDKIQTIAFGEQKPLCSESTDACWQRDRRVNVGFRTGN